MGAAVAPLVRRQEELGVLAAARAAAADGPVLAVILGAAGLGKTRLVEEVAAAAAESGSRVLRGSCLRLSVAGLSWAPWTQALRGLLRREGRDCVSDLVGERAAEALAPVLPLGSGTAPPVPHTLEALLALVEALAEQRPLLVALEDLHWADPLSVDALAFLVRNLAPVPVLLLATARPDAEGAWSAALPELLHEPGTRLVELAPLDAEGTAELARALGRQPDDAVHRLSGGNPFHITQLAQAPPGEHPSAAVLSRLRGAHPLARPVLELLAVADVPLAQDVLALAAGAAEAVVAEALRDLTGRALLVTGPDGHAPAHALVADAVLGGLLPGERAARARALAQALAGDPERLPLPRLLALTALAVAACAPELPALLPVAARRALQEGDPAAALAWSLRALEDGAGERGPLLALAADACLRTGDPRAAVPLLEQALAEPDADDPETAGVRLERLAHAQWRSGGAEASLRTGRRAQALLPAGASPARARVLAAAAAALMQLGRWEEAEAQADEAVRVAEQAGVPTVRAHAQVTRSVARSGRAQHAPALQDLADGLATARTAGDVELLVRALLNGVLVTEAAGELDRAVALAQEALGVAQRHALGPDAVRAARTNACWALHAAGRWQEASALLAEAPPGEVARDRYALLEARVAAAFAVERGDPVPEEVLRAHEADAEPHAGLARLQLCATQALWSGRPAQALECACAGLDGDGSALERARLALTAVRAVAEQVLTPVALGGAPPEQAAALRDRLPALLAHLPGGTGELAALRETAQAEAARARGEAADWEAVVASWDATGRRYDAARARLRLAEAAPSDRAGEVLRAAHLVAVDLGARPLRAELEALAVRRRLPLQVEPVATAAPDPLAGLSLTPRERQVLLQLAAGASNRAIARALFITEKTASVHVSNLLGKLGVRSRAEATAVAHRLGLAPVEREHA